jgi:hypothetical protein
MRGLVAAHLDALEVARPPQGPRDHATIRCGTRVSRLKSRAMRFV